MNQSGVFTLVFYLLITLVTLLFAFAIVIPIASLLTAGIYQGSQPIFDSAATIAPQITDANISAAVSGGAVAGKGTIQTQIDSLNLFNLYSWVLIAVAVCVVVVVYTRKLVSNNSGQGVY